MKKILLFITLLSALTLSSGLASSVTNASSVGKKERAMVTFTEPVKLMGVTLRGDYLFVHNEEAMLRGDECSYIYKGPAEIPDNLVVSFHCTPAERAKASRFTVRTDQIIPGQNEITEYQFAGSTEAHLVRTSVHTGHIPITGLR